MPRGRLLGPGDRVVYDVDSRFPGESQPPQLEVTPITKYISDPGLVLGRQIAVNRAYICYGLKLGNIRILNINTALRELLRGHTQRVTDMAFFAEDVHLLASAGVDGRVYVWKIDEGPGGEGGKPQITGKAVIAIQIVGDEASYHPRICWHSHKQEILVVAIGNCVLKVDTTKVGKGKEFSAEEPLKCPIDKLIDGVQLIGRHDGEVTDLSISQWMTTRLVSASKDGTVKIWEDRKATPLVTLRPHYGQPVNSVEFLTSPHRPDHIVLVTAGPLNREVKIWASTSEEGWLLPSDSESWQCTQTLELISSAEPQPEEAFFNQLAVLPRGSLLLVANAKKNSIYAVHIDYGACPASTRMDYIADFSVAMPILSLTGTCDCLPNGEQVVQVYCFQTHAIQQYALDLSQCLPPPNDNTVLEKDSCNSRGFDASKATLPGSSSGIAHSAIYRATSGSSDIPNISDRTTSNAEAKLATSLSSENMDVPFVASPSIPLNSDPSGRVSALGVPHKGLETRPSADGRDVDHSILDYSVDMRVDSLTTNESVFPSIDGNSGKTGSKVVLNDNSMVPNSPLMFNLGGNSAHLITPAEILSGTIPQSENALINHAPKGDEAKVQNLVSRNDVLRTEVGAELVGERLNQHEEAGLQKQRNIPSEHKEKSFGSDISEPNYEKAKEPCSLTTENSTVEVGTPLDDNSVTEALEQPSATREEDSEHSSSEPEKATESVVTIAPQSLSVANGKKQKEKQFEVSGPSSPSLSPSNSTEASNEPESNTDAPLTEAAFPQILAMQDKLNQLMSMQKEMQKQMSSIVGVPVTKEGRRVEAALGRSMEKAVKSNSDALWARFQEENAKREKAEKERMQQITGLITSCINKDLPAVLERVLKKEISTVAPSLARAVTPVIEKAISSAITDSFQRGVGDKAVNQLEKSVSSKLEASMSRQIQAQFQTAGKQALQDALKSNLETSVIPAFEVSCKAMFEQVDAVFQKGMTEYTCAAQQQFESTHTPLVLTLRDAISSASSITQNMTSELADGQRKILTLLTVGNPKSSVPAVMQQSNGPIPGLPEALTVQQVESPLDPTKELTRLISERKYDEAFTSALQRSNVTIVSWLCSQVDLHGICSMVPIPLSQGVLLALLQQLACDISNETPRKIGWMTSVAVAINPTDPMITLYVRPILEQVYNILAHQRSSPDIRALMHVINSVLMSCK